MSVDKQPLEQLAEVASRYLPKLDWHKDAFNETYKSQIALLLEGLKLLALANGGAVVALLSFAGALASNCAKSPNLSGPFAWFAYGVVACIVSFFAGYIMQMNFLKLLATQEKKYLLGHKLSFMIAIGTVCAAVALLLVGANQAITEFAGFKCERIESTKTAP